MGGFPCYLKGQKYRMFQEFRCKTVRVSHFYRISPYSRLDLQDINYLSTSVKQCLPVVVHNISLCLSAHITRSNDAGIKRSRFERGVERISTKIRNEVQKFFHIVVFPFLIYPVSCTKLARLKNSH